MFSENSLLISTESLLVSQEMDFGTFERSSGNLCDGLRPVERLGA